jgi:hypothetical protein
MNEYPTYIFIFSALLLLPSIAFSVKSGLGKILKLPLFLIVQIYGFLGIINLILMNKITQSLGGVYLTLSLLVFLRFNFVKAKGAIPVVVFSNLFIQVFFIYFVERLNDHYFSLFSMGYILFNSLYFQTFVIKQVRKFERKTQFNEDKIIMKSLENKLFSALKESEKSALIPGVMHELSHPVTILLARIAQLKRLLGESDLNGDVLYLMDQMKSLTEKLSKIIHHTREFVYATPSERRTFSFSEVYKNLMIFWDQRLKNHGVSFRLYGDENLQLFGNPRDVEQILLLFIHFAFEETQYLQNKWIEISLEEKDTEVLVRFSISEIKEQMQAEIDLSVVNELCRINSIFIDDDNESQYVSWNIRVPRPPQQIEEVLMYH